MWRCPVCKSKDHLQVVIETWAELVQPDADTDDFSTIMIEGDHEWSANSTMMCTNPACAESHDTHTVEHFEVEDEPAADEELDGDNPATSCTCIGEHDGNCAFARFSNVHKEDE